ncbi:Mss4-like protein [Aspergillus novoparasiticus]|uniref:Mss4-like protein n=1 Tax=Aspergillus novoparasiticus TaxID=986946 RepID=A0A5N6EBE9_9EURO|nr:Mss4-like protein [Aspergillus novoparasiticus]
MVAARDNSKPYIPIAGGADDGWSKDSQATATCYCGAVQLAFPTQGPGLIDAFTCHCTNCRKITASMFATNFIVAYTHLRHIRGQENLKFFSQSKIIASGMVMTNYFCTTCGSLIILRTGTVDDFTLYETKLKPRFELYTNGRVGWLQGATGVAQVKGSAYTPKGPGPWGP